MIVSFSAKSLMASCPLGGSELYFDIISNDFFIPLSVEYDVKRSLLTIKGTNAFTLPGSMRKFLNNVR